MYNAVGDFIRNFLMRYKMTRTLDAFQCEWYELQQRGELDNLELVQDCYLQNEELQNKVKFLEEEIEKMRRGKAGACRVVDVSFCRIEVMT